MATFRKATKEKAKLRMAIIGLAGSGKTYSALAIGSALVPNARVALIDTECGSASLYADKFSFDTMDLATHSPLAYVDAIKAAEAEGYDVIVVDSLSHAWTGKDGALEQKDKAADRGGNSYTAWRDVTPKHQKLVETIIASRCHVIATIRSKMEYVQEKNPATGKTEIRKVGLAAVQRDGLEYEFGLVGDMDLQHQLKISKTRFDGAIEAGEIFEKPGALLAKKISEWLAQGVEPAARVAAAAAVAAAPVVGIAPAAEPAPTALDAKLDDAFAAYLAAMPRAKTLPELDAAASGPGKPTKGTPEAERAKATYLACKAAIEKAATKAAEQAQGAA